MPKPKTWWQTTTPRTRVRSPTCRPVLGRDRRRAHAFRAFFFVTWCVHRSVRSGYSRVCRFGPAVSVRAASRPWAWFAGRVCSRSRNLSAAVRRPLPRQKRPREPASLAVELIETQERRAVRPMPDQIHLDFGNAAVYVVPPRSEQRASTKVREVRQPSAAGVPPSRLGSSVGLAREMAVGRFW